MEGGIEGKNMEDKQKQTDIKSHWSSVLEPREAAHPMEKTAAGVYTNSPTGPVV